jgi:hypothetical protein
MAALGGCEDAEKRALRKRSAIATIIRGLGTIEPAEPAIADRRAPNASPDQSRRIAKNVPSGPFAIEKGFSIATSWSAWPASGSNPSLLDADQDPTP